MIALGKIGMGWMDEDTLAKERFSECRETAQGKSRNPQSTRRDDMEEKEGDGGRSYDAKDCDEFSTFADSVSERSQDEWRGGNEVDSSRMFKRTPSSSSQTEIIFRHCRHGRTSQNVLDRHAISEHQFQFPRVFSVSKYTDIASAGNGHATSECILDQLFCFLDARWIGFVLRIPSLVDRNGFRG